MKKLVLALLVGVIAACGSTPPKALAHWDSAQWLAESEGIAAPASFPISTTTTVTVVRSGGTCRPDLALVSDDGKNDPIGPDGATIVLTPGNWALQIGAGQAMFILSGKCQGSSASTADVTATTP